jgi:hypothetical protein
MQPRSPAGPEVSRRSTLYKTRLPGSRRALRSDVRADEFVGFGDERLVHPQTPPACGKRPRRRLNCLLPPRP